MVNRLMSSNLALNLPGRLVRLNRRAIVLVAGVVTVVLVTAMAGAAVVGESQLSRTESVPPMGIDGYVGGGTSGLVEPSFAPGAAPRNGVLGAPDLASKEALAAQSVGASAPGAPAGGVDLPPLEAIRPIIRTGSVDIAVKSVGETFDQVRLLATQAGGLVASSNFMGSSKQSTAQLVLRIPGDRFNETVSRLRDMAVEVQGISTGSQDVADQLTDLDATLRNLRAVEARYLVMLDSARNLAEILQVQDRINQVRLQIERTEARRQLINSQVEMSTLTVTLRPVGIPGNTSQPATVMERVTEAWNASLQALETVATAVLLAIVYTWWIVVLAAVGILALRRFVRSTPAAPPTA